MPFSEEVLEDQGHERVKGIEPSVSDLAFATYRRRQFRSGGRRSAKLRESRCELGFAG